MTIDTNAVRQIVAEAGGAAVSFPPAIIEQMLKAIDRGQAAERAVINIRTIAGMVPVA